MAEQIPIELVLDDGKLIKGFANVGKVADETAKKIGQSFSSSVEDKLGSGLASAGKKLLAIGAAVGSAFAFKKMIDAASQQEDAINSLNAALLSQGKFTQSASDSFVRFAESLQRTTTVADDTIIKGGALISSLSGLTGQGLEKATQASLDLAAALNIDTSTAFNIMGKAAAGNTGALSRYGVQVKSSGDASKDFARVLDLVNQKFAGQAIQKVNTFSGAMSQLDNNFNDVLESFGNVIIKSPVVIEAIKFISQWFSRLAVSLGDILNQQAFDQFLIGAISFSKALVQTVGPTIELVTNLITGLGKSLGVVGAAIAQALSGEFSQSMETLKTGLSESFSGAFDFSGTESVEKFVTGLETSVMSAQPRVVTAGQQTGKNFSDGVTQGVSWDAFVTSFNSAATGMKITAASLASQLKQTIGTGVGNAFAAFGGALAKGENALEAFGKTVLGVFGDILINLGTQTLAVGIGMSAVPILFGLQGPAAIVAGAIMATAGGALKALAGAGGGGGASAALAAPTGGGGVAAEGTAELNNPLTQQQVEAQQRTAVQINVQGSVFDSKETGLRIADIVRESFETSGVVTVS